MSQSMYGLPPEFADGGNSGKWATELAPYERHKLKVILDVSNKCNLRCRMCHFSFDDVFYRPAQHMHPEMFKQMADSVLPFAHTVILSAGNEPLMSPWFSDILKICAPYQVPNLLFITNAQLLNERIAEAILESGVTQVQISADGATRETYEYIRRGASFDRLLQNLKYLSARKRTLPLLQFNVVLMRRNLEELEKYVDLAEEVGVEWIAARHLLVVKGLDMESESLSGDRERANYFFERFLRRVDRSNSVTVIEFPDFFDGYQMTAQASEEPASSPAICDAIPASGARPEAEAGKAASSERSLTQVPFGYVDLPADTETQVNNAIQFVGWALDDVQVVRVSIQREPLASDAATDINRLGFIEIGEAKMLNGSRPDVARAFPLHPHNYRAGWSFELRRDFISQEQCFKTVIHIVAHNAAGLDAEIGRKTITFSTNETAKPYLFCSKPFDSVYIDSKGNVNPYPDCRPVKPFGSLADEGASIRDIWFGKDFTELRQRIIDRDPPPMCLSCAYFINRNVGDQAYFVPR